MVLFQTFKQYSSDFKYPQTSTQTSVYIKDLHEVSVCAQKFWFGRNYTVSNLL